MVSTQTIRRVGLIPVLLVFAFACAAQDLPEPFEAEYEGSKFLFNAKATIALSRVGDYYQYTMRSVVYLGPFAQGKMYDCSLMRASGNGLQAVEYVHRDTRHRRHDVHTRFDWSNRTARTELGDDSVRVINDLQQTAWDVMSIQTRLMMDVAAAGPGDRIEYALLEKGDMTHHMIKIEGMEVIDSGEHSLHAVKVRVDGPKGTNWFWFARDYAWLPVRLSISGVNLQLVSRPEQARREIVPAGADAPRC